MKLFLRVTKTLPVRYKGMMELFLSSLPTESTLPIAKIAGTLLPDH
eukprot:CAMPEP_0202347280 /NCGR_PEP_ID=MMETSP1126-20121109/5710_1 /ASSEMBLY_ACC=CAM_ASM_000457 /TAXON_ID=3047 /ORGANISM="Dunaliella tertiolecta, Strain CCMP1320" /LENGTH=45 /DNA_ID= /DNA_START= /DNA_END= /DNA_ORIENTATION=